MGRETEGHVFVKVRKFYFQSSRDLKHDKQLLRVAGQIQ